MVEHRPVLPNHSFNGPVGGIVHIYNLGESQEIPHFVMEYLEGSPLTEAARAYRLVAHSPTRGTRTVPL